MMEVLIVDDMILGAKERSSYLYALEDWELNDYILEDSERNVEKCLGRKISPFKSGGPHGVLENKKIHRIQHRK